MYLNDHLRTAFYESLGMNTRQFNQHVIIETNKSVARVFPQVGGEEYWLGVRREWCDTETRLSAAYNVAVRAPWKSVTRV